MSEIATRRYNEPDVECASPTKHFEWRIMLDLTPESAVRMLPSLNREIQLLTVREENARGQIKAVRRQLKFAKLVHRFHNLQASLRSPKETYQLWPIGITLTVPMATGLLLFILAHTILGSYAMSFALAGVFSLIAAGALAKILYFTDDRLLSIQLHEDRFHYEESLNKYKTLSAEHIDVRRALVEACERHRKIMSVVGDERMRLLSKNWRDMRGDEWEDFLFEVFSALGAKVRHTGRTGDHGVDLIVEIGSRRYAVQAKGYRDSVGNSAVQEAVAGMAMYQCNCCAVVTNSNLTNAAVALADVNCCLLIGGDNIRSLILGQIKL